jgi:hypothetical protein
MEIGYFANQKRWTKTHLINEAGNPICGAIINDDMEFQWCSGGRNITYIECSHCQKKWWAIENKKDI